MSWAWRISYTECYSAPLLLCSGYPSPAGKQTNTHIYLSLLRKGGIYSDMTLTVLKPSTQVIQYVCIWMTFSHTKLFVSVFMASYLDASFAAWSLWWHWTRRHRWQCTATLVRPFGERCQARLNSTIRLGASCLKWTYWEWQDGCEKKAVKTENKMHKEHTTDISF